MTLHLGWWPFRSVFVLVVTAVLATVMFRGWNDEPIADVPLDSWDLPSGDWPCTPGLVVVCTNPDQADFGLKIAHVENSRADLLRRLREIASGPDKDLLMLIGYVGEDGNTHALSEADLKTQ